MKASPSLHRPLFFLLATSLLACGDSGGGPSPCERFCADVLPCTGGGGAIPDRDQCLALCATEVTASEMACVADADGCFAILACHESQAELCGDSAGGDEDGDGLVNCLDPDCAASAACATDEDHDGFGPDVDCDDGDEAVSPAAPEVPYDGVDNDCDETSPDDDLDFDSYPRAEDCDDARSDVAPGRTEVPYDGVDNDCDPETPDDDLDDDGVPHAGDCDDQDDEVSPSVREVPYDEVDNDCDPQTLDDDLDHDGHRKVSWDEAGHFTGDCDDADPDVHAGATEIPYNGKDDDCETWTREDDLDRDGHAKADDCDDADSVRWFSGTSSEVRCYEACSQTFDGDLTLQADHFHDSVTTSCVKAVTGSLRVEAGPFAGNSNELPTLGGLAGLESVGGDLVINDLSIESVADLGRLRTVGGRLEIARTDALTSLDGLNALTSVGGLTLEDNSALERIDGLGGVVVSGDVRIVQNDVLASLAGLDGARDLVSLTVDGLPALEDASGLAGLVTVGFDLVIDLCRRDAFPWACPPLTALALPSLEQVGGRLVIRADSPVPAQGSVALPALRSTGSFELGVTWLADLQVAALETVGVSFNLSSSSLSDLSAFGPVFEDASEVHIESNRKLTRLTGLTLPAAIDKLEVLDNAELVDIEALTPLTSVGWLTFWRNPALADLAPLAHLERVGGLEFTGLAATTIDLAALGELGSLHIGAMSELVAIHGGTAALQSVSLLYFQNSPRLADIRLFDGLSSVGVFSSTECPELLPTFSGVEVEALYLNHGYAGVDLRPFAPTSDMRLALDGLPALVSLAGLEALTDAGVIAIGKQWGNGSLEDVSALLPMTSACSVYIWSPLLTQEEIEAVTQGLVLSCP